MSEPAEIISIPVRPNVIVRVHGIPWDLTEAEAERLAQIIRAYANPNLTLQGEQS